MIGFYGIFTQLTYLGLLFAVLGMYYAFNENTLATIICLMAAGVCDMFDGYVARKTKRTDQEKSYGVQIDALADLVSFGVFPALIGYSIGLNKLIHFAVFFVYIIAALIRLAYFNVTEMERQGPRTHYEGLPVTGVAIIIPLLYFISLWFDFELATIYGGLLIVIAVLFLLKIKVPKPKLKTMIIFCTTAIIIVTILSIFLLG